jgi:Tfp pilus assembly protein PilO
MKQKVRKQLLEEAEYLSHLVHELRPNDELTTVVRDMARSGARSALRLEALLTDLANSIEDAEKKLPGVPRLPRMKAGMDKTLPGVRR